MGDDQVPGRMMRPVVVQCGGGHVEQHQDRGTRSIDDAVRGGEVDLDVQGEWVDRAEDVPAHVPQLPQQAESALELAAGGDAPDRGQAAVM